MSLAAWLQTEWHEASAWQVLLRPLSWGFAMAASARRAAFATGLATVEALPVPVVVVGNISAGGTGKTPLTLALTEALRARGFTPGIVSRGYGAIADDHGRQARVEVHQAPPGHSLPDWFGDEPLVLAQRLAVPVYVGADRVAAARALLADHPGTDVLVCDDGLQHYRLGRRVEVAVVDGERGFGNGHLLPAGPLREPVERLGRVHAVVWHGGAISEALAALPKSVDRALVFPMRLGSERFVSLVSGEEYTPSEFLVKVSGARVVALAGIGHPQRFFDHLTRLGLAARALAFADHHRFTARELALPDAEVVVMTEKDAVKCRAFADSRMWMLQVDALVPGEFYDRIASLLRPH